MPDIPTGTILGYIGVILLFLGLFFFITGIGLVNIKDITVMPGRKTISVGVIFLAVGIFLVLPDISKNAHENAGTTAIEMPIPTLTHTIIVANPTSSSAPSAIPSETLPSLMSEVNSEMVRLPEGYIYIGSSSSPGEIRDYHNAHKVFISEIYIDKYEVTNKQYYSCVLAKICHEPKVNSSNRRENYYNNLDEYGDFPV